MTWIKLRTCGAEQEVPQLACYTRLDSPKEPVETHVIKKLLQLYIANGNNPTLVGLENAF